MSQPIRLEFLSTGTVRIRPLMRSQPAGGYSILRRLRAILDRGWTEPLPVGVFLIHHPEGIYLFDTGQPPRCNEPGYFPRTALFNNMLRRFTLDNKDGIVAQLRERGIEPRDLKGVVISHLHNYHAGVLEELVAAAPGLVVYVSREHWRAGFAPRIVGFQSGRPVGPWRGSYPLTEDGKVVVVDTSGHVPGHMSVVVYGGSNSSGGGGRQTTYMLPGDAAYGIDNLVKEEPDGISDDPLRALETLRRIKEFARGEEVVVLPSHDPDTLRILAERAVYQPM
ncbi:hypothetical protein AJ79_00943 [Helicocarpus griseus UAMH5409]|uniref:Metallo-beta-lactamase domain-containing protein n=1 Tax=Helicocarpus griseus UAMH5409 TaxID=1447875 RepID=A0A2B7YAB2_9EURO|nr:hypothetical protein AJ79_00943 [Helicocarpus griseus UAMH5409]